MKEKNKNRKLELKKQREQIMLRKQLHRDISMFMVELNAATCTNPYDLLNKVLMNGFKGYERVRGKDLIKLFDKYYAMLRNEKEPFPLNYEVTFTHTKAHQVIHGHWRNVDKYRTEEVRSDLLFKSDALMNRLMEIAFDLDFHE